MIIKWSSRYETGVDKFDSQHKNLFAMILKLQEAMEKNEGAMALRGILENLIGYTMSHFRDEEEAMLKSGYPALASHKLEHMKLQKEVEKYHADVVSGKMVFSGTILNFLVNWLKDHIAKTDMKYAPYLKPPGGKGGQPKSMV
jgi:hemerythrin